MFILLLIAQACSLTGGYVQTLALSWITARQAGGLLTLSFYMLACYLPVALLSYPFGRFLDGRPQKKWLIGSELLLFCLSAILWQGAKRAWITYPFLLVFGALWGVVRAFQTPLYQSLPRRLSRNLSKGTAALTVVTDLARGLGPILGGLLLYRFGEALPFLVNFLSFIPSLLLLCFLKIPQVEKGEKPKIKNYLPRLLMIFLTALFATNYNVTLVGLVKDAGFDSWALGIAMGLLAAGALLGFFIKKNRQEPFSLPLLAGGMGLLNLALAVKSPLWLMGGEIVLYGILDFWYFSSCMLILSKEASSKEATAVMGLYAAVTVGAVPLGALLWSAVARGIGLACAFLLIGIGLLLFAILFFRFEKRSHLFKP